MGERVPRTRCAGTMTENQYKNWVISLLRKGTLRWKPRGIALRARRDGKVVNPDTGKMCIASKCDSCGERFMEKLMKVDHINPVVDPLKGWEGFDSFIKNLFCEVDNFQILCKVCHDKKSKEETELRKKTRRNR